MRLALALFFSISVFAEIAQNEYSQFLGEYELVSSHIKQTCSSFIKVKDWPESGLLDFQGFDKSDEFVNEDPTTRKFIKGSYVFNLNEWLVRSSDKKYKTYTYMKRPNVIVEETYKKQWLRKRFKLSFAVSISRVSVDDQLAYDGIYLEIRKKGDSVKKCHYKRVK